MTEVANVDFSVRQTLPEVDPQFTRRWSPRALQKARIPEQDLAAIFEAARWSPSCFNDQPWRFYTSTDATFDAFLNLLNSSNQTWAKNAALLGFVVSRQHFRHNGKPNAHADFDSGAAWMAVALQAHQLGYHAHGMAGVNFDAAYDYLGLDRDKFRVICAFALGRRGDPALLTPEQQTKESPSSRVPLQEVWFSKSE